MQNSFRHSSRGGNFYGNRGGNELSTCGGVFKCEERREALTFDLMFVGRKARGGMSAVDRGKKTFEARSLEEGNMRRIDEVCWGMVEVWTKFEDAW
jgi:hypothetical protein